MDKLRKKQLIEVALLWEGRLTTKTLQDYFAISRRTAQNLISEYQDNHEANLVHYDSSLKYHQPSKVFVPHYTQGNLQEYLHFFGNTTDGILQGMGNFSPYLEQIPSPVRNIDPVLTRSVIQACKQQKRLDIGYFSVSSGVTESRIISPHSLIFDGIRWHTRAWCERSMAYRDFVLSRFHDEPVFEDDGAIKLKEHDQEWNTMIDLIIEPDPRLNAHQRHAIELDYKMAHSQLKIPCRAALVKYLIQKLRLDSYHQNPQGQQIIVQSDCWQQLEPYRMK